jgi:hypothetical protein
MLDDDDIIPNPRQMRRAGSQLDIPGFASRVNAFAAT